MTGQVIDTYYYDAFGNIMEEVGDTNNPYRYAGYQYDAETGLYYLNARMYDPKIARFLQEDTYLGDPQDVLSLNLYTYCHNNPLTYHDPTGHLPHVVITSFFGGLIGGAIDLGAQIFIQRKSFNELNWKSVGQSFVEGAISGAIAGATGGASLVASAGKQTAKLTAKQVAKTAGKTAVVHGTTGAAINAAAQYAVKGEVNTSEVILSGAIDSLTGGVGSALPHTRIGNAITTFTDNVATNAKGFINTALDNTRMLLADERGSIGRIVGKNIDDVVDLEVSETKGLYSTRKTGIPINAEKFSKMKTAFARQGGIIDQSAEAQRYLDYKGAEAATFNESTILMRPNPTVSDVFEEFIHTAQYRTGKIPDQLPMTVLINEIEAAEKLIRYRKAYGIPNVETRQTIQRLRNMRNELVGLSERKK